MYQRGKGMVGVVLCQQRGGFFSHWNSLEPPAHGIVKSVFHLHFLYTMHPFMLISPREQTMATTPTTFYPPLVPQEPRKEMEEKEPGWWVNTRWVWCVLGNQVKTLSREERVVGLHRCCWDVEWCDVRDLSLHQAAGWVQKRMGEEDGSWRMHASFQGAYS